MILGWDAGYNAYRHKCSWCGVVFYSRLWDRDYCQQCSAETCTQKDIGVKI